LLNKSVEQPLSKGEYLERGKTTGNGSRSHTNLGFQKEMKRKGRGENGKRTKRGKM